MADINEIFVKLLERTNQGKVQWEPTSDEDTFVAGVGNLSVSLTKYRNGNLIFRILNEQGREIQSGNSNDWVFDDSLGGPPPLEELYDQAKHGALQVDARLDELLNELG